jgi:hypothetical protein
MGVVRLSFPYTRGYYIGVRYIALLGRICYIVSADRVKSALLYTFGDIYFTDLEKKQD